MQLRPVILSALVAVAALATAAPVAAADAGAVDTCIQYMYVDDYHWYYVCANPTDLSCPVYHKYVQGVTPHVTCIPPQVVEPVQECVPFANDLERAYYLCVDQTDATCAAYVWVDGWNGGKYCYGVL